MKLGPGLVRVPCTGELLQVDDALLTPLPVPEHVRALCARFERWAPMHYATRLAIVHAYTHEPNSFLTPEVQAHVVSVFEGSLGLPLLMLGSPWFVFVLAALLALVLYAAGLGLVVLIMPIIYLIL